MKLSTKYVAAVSPHDARTAFQGSNPTRVYADPEFARQDAAKLTKGDRCEPQCVYRVYEISTEILPWRG